ncbi:MAG TPA: GNAT family N-acetyltransferase [Candidatus Sulfotelmatobacter sp.]|nr:GNAT family N-acetyltransferase [Candidatus Sulfotelmatobacter sp.]
MLSIRPAGRADEPGILKVLDEADLHYGAEELNGFYVCEENGRIVGTVRLEEHPDFLFLTSLGVLPDHRHQGIATSLLINVLTRLSKPVYLYTVIPEFFKKQGFSETAAYPDLPPKNIFGCDECVPGHCVVMVKRPER